MDLFLRYLFYGEIFAGLGDFDKIICPWKESVPGKYTI